MTMTYQDPNSHRRVLLISNSAIGPRMSGPGIRYWELARALRSGAGLDVTLATVPGVPAGRWRSHGDAPVRLHAARDEADLRAQALQADVFVAPGAVISLYPSLARVETPLALDLYIPLSLEELQRTRSEALAEQALVFEGLRGSVSNQLLRADFILCASDKQRDYWLGALSALGRVNPYTHADDPTLRKLIDVVPFGLPSHPPKHKRQVLKGVVPGIGADDKVLLWGGGLWDWLDTSTLLQAMARLAGNRSDIKLFFMGVQHRNPQEAQRRGTLTTLSLADELGLAGRSVFFNDWVPYEERGDYLLEADVGVSLHRDHLESRFSFRTRFLDNLWAGLPLIATRGDVLSHEVERRGLGRVVVPGDVDGLVEAILDMVDAPDLRQHPERLDFKKAAEAYRWEVVARPLVEFCRHPHRATDRDYVASISRANLRPTRRWRLPGKVWRALARQAQHNRRGRKGRGCRE